MTAKPPAALADPRQPSALLHILNEVAAALQGASSEKQAFDILRGQLQERGYGSTLALVTEAGDRLAFYATAMQNRTIAALLQQAGRLSGVKAEGRAFELARTPRYQRVIASGQGEFLPDNRQVMGDMLAASFPGAAWPLVGLMVKALRPAPALCVPLRRSGQVRGVWVITAPGLSEADLPVMEAFASQIGAALETGGLVAATQPELQERHGTEPTLRQVVARMEMLHAIDRAIRAAESPETTAAAALAGIRQLVPCVRASVSLFDYSTNQTRVLAVDAAGPSHMGAGDSRPLSEYGPLDNLRQGRPEIIPDVAALPQRTETDERFLAEGVRAWMLVPLIYQDELIGGLNLGGAEPNAFGPEDLQLAREIADRMAMAIQQARLITQTTEALRREQQLNEVAHAISGSLSPPVVLQTVVRLAVEIINADAGSVDLLDAAGEILTNAYGINLPPHLMGQTLPRGRGVVWQVVDSGQARMLEHYPSLPEALPEWIEFGAQTFLSAPLVASDHVLGSLTLFSLAPNRTFSSRDLALVESIGRQAGVAIQNARLFEAAQQRNRETLALLASAEAISASLGFKDALRAVAEQAVSLMEANGSRVHLLEPDGVTLSCVIARENESEQIMAMRLQLGQGFTGRVAQSGEPMRVLSPDRAGIGLRVPGTSDDPESLALVPLKWQERVIGVMTVIRQGHERPFSEAELRVLTGLAAHAASAIVNARLFEASRQELSEREKAEARLRLSDEILQRVASLVLVADRDGRVTFASESFRSVLGYEPQELLGEGWWQRRGSNGSGLSERDTFGRIARGELPLRDQQYEDTVLDRKGETHWILWQDMPGPGGSLIGVGHDITERKRSEEQLREAELRYRTLVEQNPAITYIVPPDVTARALYVSPQIESVLGFTPEEWLADPGLWSRLLHPGDREAVLAQERRTRLNALPFSMEYRIFRKDGRAVWLHDEYRWVLDESGQPAFAQGIEFDISERKRSEAELARQLQEIQALFRISQLLGGTLALTDILQQIAETAASVMARADRVVMHLLDASGGVLQPVALAGPDQGSVRNRLHFRWGQGLAGLAIATGKTINVADAPRDPRYVPLDSHGGRVRALAVAPVQVGDKRLGTLSVHSRSVGAFTAEDERLLTTLGVQAGLAIEKARLFESERRRAEEAEALQQVTRTLINRRRLRDLLQDAADAMAMIGKYRRIVINLRDRDTLVPVAQRGYRADELWVLSVNEGVIGRIARTGVPAFVENTDLDPDSSPGGAGATSLIGVPLTHGDRLLGVLTVEAPLETPLDQNDLNWLMNIGRQISSAVENARLNADLEAALQQEQATRAQLVQNEKLAAMGKLVASVAHELNNPLQAIQNALFLVQQEHDLSEQTRADLDVAATETHRMADLIARLRDTYRPATGEQFQPEQVNAIVEDVHRLIATHLRQSQVAFDFRPDPELPPVLAIRDQLKQAILNLSINAVEAMSASGQLTIETHYVPPANEVSLSVSDTGSGIDPADLPNVFDPFFTTKASGTGLGLAITHDIARRHGGRLEVSSELGRGSTFILHLPVSGPPPGAGILQSK